MKISQAGATAFAKAFAAGGRRPTRYARHGKPELELAQLRSKVAEILSTTPGPDVRVQDEGTVVMFEPVTDTAREWVALHVEVPGWAWIGPRFGCEHRLADNLIAGMTDAGLVVS